MEGQYILVTTLHKGVFAGVLKERSGKDYCVLTEARNCIYFGTTKGFLELADTGPTSNSKIGSLAVQIELWDITSYTICTPDAELAWRAA